MAQIKKKILYWSPFFSKIATPLAVVNSANSINKYSKNYVASVINFFGEFKNFEDLLKKQNTTLINFYKINILKYLPKYGKINSRFSFLIIFILSILPLHKTIRNLKPKYLVLQLITSLPLILLILFNYETKFILRISGFPRLGVLRKFLWKIAFKKIYAVTCPTKNTYNYIKKLNIISDNKLKVLYDPILEINKINNLKKEQNLEKNNHFISVGRLTKQKNFIFLLRAFSELIKKNKDLILYIVGEGEEKKKLINYIYQNNLQKNIFLIGYKKNIFPYLVSAKGFILTSLWEDPGFVLVEAGYTRLPIFSCDADPGPSELIKDLYNGTTFKNNNLNNFVEKFDIYLSNINNKTLLLNNLKFLKKFTLFSHFQQISNILYDL